MSKNQQNFWRESATNLLAYLRISYKSPCLFANDLQISLLIYRSLQISLPICESSTNLPAYLRQKFYLFLLIRPVILNGPHLEAPLFYHHCEEKLKSVYVRDLVSGIQ